MTNPVERAAEALRPWAFDPTRITPQLFRETQEQARERQQGEARGTAVAVFESIDPDDLAKALADDWNPDRDPILTAMFRDYAQTVIAHLTGKDQT